jgi:hypothetical protein
MTITVTITQAGKAVGEIEIDGDDVADRSSDLVHVGGMVECGRDDVLYRAAHATSLIAEHRALVSTLGGLDRKSESTVGLPEDHQTAAEPPPPRVREKTAIPCIVCGRELEDEFAGNNQPVRGLAFQSYGHWPSSVFDGGPGWLEINVCEPCMKSAAERHRILHGERELRRSPAVYKLWDWPRGARE